MLNIDSNIVLEDATHWSIPPDAVLLTHNDVTTPKTSEPVRILHLEDNLKDAELVQANLATNLVCRITRVQTRDEFIDALKRGGYDVILADFSLPNYDGFSALRLARAECPNIPFIFVSGAMQDHAALEGVVEGATNFVTKQKLSQLVPIVERALRDSALEFERQRNQEALRRSEEKFSRVFQASPGMISIIRLNNRCYVDVNRAFVEHTGYDLDQVAGRPISEIAPFDDAQEIAWAFQKLLTDGSFSDLETPFHTKAGKTRVGRFSGQVIEVDGEHCAMLVGEDITERKQADQVLLRRLTHLRAQNLINQTMMSSHDLKLTLNVFLAQVTLQLGVDAADILLLNPLTHRMELGACVGFRGDAIKRSMDQVAKEHLNPAMIGHQMVHIANLNDEHDAFMRPPWASGENFVAYYRVPLVTRNQMCGILEIYHRASLECDAEWLAFLESFANQASISIGTAMMFEELQHAHAELETAFEATLAGWSSDLDARCQETEGHTRRVTDLTVKLARALGLNEDEIVHLRRGSLLHNLGKLNVPDNLLLKPSRLNEDESAITLQHSQFVLELIRTIEFLHPSLDIPQSYHEKWDGTGYSQGLRGENIPLAARIFALAETWDVLTSDYPDRPAWSKEATLVFIREHTGTHFDPSIVPIFLKLMKSETEEDLPSPISLSFS